MGRLRKPSVKQLALLIALGSALWTAGCGEDEDAADPGQVTAEIPLELTFPNQAWVAAGAGAVWVTDAFNDRVLHINPETGELIAGLRVGDSPISVAVGEGAVWVSNLRGGVSRIDPRNGRVGRTVPVGSVAPGGYVVGPLTAGEGAAWATDPPENAVRRIDARSGELSGGPIPIQAPRFIAAGEGAVWAATENGTVIRIHRLTTRRGPAIEADGAAGIAAGEGGVWVVGPGGAVRRIDPATREVSDPVELGSPATGIAAGEGGIWVGTQGGVVHIDPVSLELVGAPIAVADPGKIAVGEGAVWVISGTESSEAKLVRIDP